MNLVALLPGDVLLYRGTGLYDLVIAVKTWHHVGHVEVYAGNGESEASRNGLGVDCYPFRSADLAYVLRPNHPAFDWSVGEAWFRQMRGTAYGWLDLLQFIGVPIAAPGIVCSPFATARLRASRLPIFNDEQAPKVAPFEFLLSEYLIDVSKGVFA